MGSYVAVLQFTTQEDASDDETIAVYEITNMDESSTNDYLLASDKLENNFASVFFNNFMQ